MDATTPPKRCRIVLIAPPTASPADVEAALSGGDVASLILPGEGVDEALFQSFAEKAAAAAHAAGVAVVIAGDTRVACRVHADGIHIEGKKAELSKAITTYQKRMMVGASGAKTRDDALELGEERPDYIFFGRFGYDNKPEPHSRNLTLGQWWAEMIKIPCIVLAGSDTASVETVAATGVEFVAVSSSVFGEGINPREAVVRVNALLDENAPRLEG